MTVEQYLEEMKPGFTVPGGSDAHLVMHEIGDANDASNHEAVMMKAYELGKAL